tara:strand:+ start:16471 stop:16995 length:525 start_codon:yes stop_codon:yes gene_type:complete
LILKIISILFFFLISFSALSTNIRVIDLQSLIDNNKDLNQMILNMEIDQEIFKNNFRKKEAQLANDLESIEESKLILNSEEIEQRIRIYNEKLYKFNSEIEKFNSHYDNEISILKNEILKKILEILKKYSTENEIDLILDSNSYIISNNSINITDLINKELNNNNFDISFEKYK